MGDKLPLPPETQKNWKHWHPFESLSPSRKEVKIREPLENLIRLQRILGESLRICLIKGISIVLIAGCVC